MLYNVKRYGPDVCATSFTKSETVRSISRIEKMSEYYVTWTEEGIGTRQLNAQDFFNEHKDSCPLWTTRYEGEGKFHWTPIEVSEEIARICGRFPDISKHIQVMYMADHMWGNEFMSRLTGNTGHIAEYLK